MSAVNLVRNQTAKLKIHVNTSQYIKCGFLKKVVHAFRTYSKTN